MLCCYYNVFIDIIIINENTAVIITLLLNLFIKTEVWNEKELYYNIIFIEEVDGSVFFVVFLSYSTRFTRIIYVGTFYTFLTSGSVRVL